jgi:hypothetical protein
MIVQSLTLGVDIKVLILLFYVIIKDSSFNNLRKKN